mgnify:CR=1 FL=1
MVHACIRRSFVNKLSVTDEDDMLDADDNAKAVYRLVSKARSGQPVRLSRSTAQVFRKNLEVSTVLLVLPAACCGMCVARGLMELGDRCTRLRRTVL